MAWKISFKKLLLFIIFISCSQEKLKQKEEKLLLDWQLMNEFLLAVEKQKIKKIAILGKKLNISKEEIDIIKELVKEKNLNKKIILAFQSKNYSQVKIYLKEYHYNKDLKFLYTKFLELISLVLEYKKADENNKMDFAKLKYINHLYSELFLNKQLKNDYLKVQLEKLKLILNNYFKPTFKAFYKSKKLKFDEKRN